VTPLASKVELEDLITSRFPEVDRSLGEDYLGVTWATPSGRTQHVMVLVLDDGVFLWSPFAKTAEISLTRALALAKSTLFGVAMYRDTYALKHFVLSSDLGVESLLGHIGFLANSADALEADFKPDSDSL
jgi:hypothetical protein